MWPRIDRRHTPGVLVLLLLGLGLSDVANAALIQQRKDCSADNCLRALLRKEREESARSFCTSLLSTTLPATATAAIPTFLANCGPSTVAVSRLSSACPCFLASFTSETSTSTVATSTTTAVSTTGNDVLRLNVSFRSLMQHYHHHRPGHTTQSTCSASTITVSSPPTTVTVTTAGPTVTAQPPPASCTMPVLDSGFESNAPGAYPWLFAQSGSGAYSVGQSVVGTPGTSFPPGSNFSPHSGRVALNIRIENPAPGGFIRFWQAITPCGAATTYRPRLWFGTNAASTGTVTFVLRMWTYSVSIPNAAGTQTLFSTRRVPAPTFGQGGWVEVVFDAWNSPQATVAQIQLDVSTDRQSTTIWLDDFTIQQGA